MVVSGGGGVGGGGGGGSCGVGGGGGQGGDGRCSGGVGGVDKMIVKVGLVPRIRVNTCKEQKQTCSYAHTQTGMYKNTKIF